MTNARSSEILQVWPYEARKGSSQLMHLTFTSLGTRSSEILKTLWFWVPSLQILLQL